ncbi:hypothetical protein CK203_029467 [Vitis vinifera]|uniref:Uncharacterized protein n=1 Tax=Vitis vinifera TaxID=29760 RepID=A0A438JCG8_VITVI|nr:hypothetical protein CK203_029467 [Vitis vinifera]
MASFLILTPMFDNQVASLDWESNRGGYADLLDTGSKQRGFSFLFWWLI